MHKLQHMFKVLLPLTGLNVLVWLRAKQPASHISTREFHTHAWQDDFQPKVSMAFPWEDKCHCLVQLDEKERGRVWPA